MAHIPHRTLTLLDNHVLQARQYADAAARVAAGGLVAADIGKVAVQLDNMTFWALRSIGPVVWGQLNFLNVTDDAQLKRSANDFAAFAHKATPVDADKVLIEDSGAGGVKKYVQMIDIASSGLGSVRQAISANVPVDTSTNSNVWVTLLTVNITTIRNWIVTYATISGYLSAAFELYGRITVDGTRITSAGQAASPNKSISIAMVRRYAAAPGAHVVNLEWRVTGGTMYVNPVTQPDFGTGQLIVLEEVV